MAGVDEQIGTARSTDDGPVARCRWPQASPALNLQEVDGVGEQHLGALDQRVAAPLADCGVVAVQLRGSGYAQPVPEPRNRQLVTFVGEADAWRTVGPHHGDGDGITL